MRFTSEQRLDDGVLEREFTLGEIPGILWTPGSASAPAPLILLGHPGGLHKMYPRLVARARHSAAEGFAAATIELPGSGDRPRSAAAEEARAGLRRALANRTLRFDADVPSLDAMLAQQDLEATVRSLEVPLLLLHAEGDEVVPVEQSRELATQMSAPGSRLIAIPGGHHRSIQHDEELQAVSLRFIEQALGS